MINRINKLVIFDFDGVLVNTEYTTFDYYRKILPSYGIYLTDKDFKHKIGRKSVDFFRDVLKDKFDQKLVNKLTQMKRATFIQDVKKYLKPIPGVFKLLEEFKQAGLRMAIGSQNEKPLIQKALDEFKMRKYFEFTTSLQDIQNKKPHPEVFLLVANTLKVEPSESVVIEDAPIGIQAAKAGRFKSIGITTSFSRDNLAEADLIIDSLREIDANFIKNFSFRLK